MLKTTFSAVYNLQLSASLDDDGEADLSTHDLHTVLKGQRKARRVVAVDANLAAQEEARERIRRRGRVLGSSFSPNTVASTSRGRCRGLRRQAPNTARRRSKRVRTGRMPRVLQRLERRKCLGIERTVGEERNMSPVLRGERLRGKPLVPMLLFWHNPAHPPRVHLVESETIRVGYSSPPLQASRRSAHCPARP